MAENQAVPLVSIVSGKELQHQDSGHEAKNFYIGQKSQKVRFSYQDVKFAVSGVLPGLNRGRNQEVEDLRQWRLQMTALLKRKEEILQSYQQETLRSLQDLESEWSAIEALVADLGSEAVLSLLEETVPRGIVVLIEPSVWPLYFCVHDLAMALISGNSVILKPAEFGTQTVVRALGPWFQDRFWSQRMALLLGDREMGRRIAVHPQIDAVVFRGSFEVGVRIEQDCLAQSNKEVFLHLGSKNSSVLLDPLTPEMMSILVSDVYLGMGQHCRNVSIIWVQQNMLDDWLKDFHEHSKEVSLSPLTDHSVADRYLKFASMAEREGAEIVMRGKPANQEPKGQVVTPTIALYRQWTPETILKSVPLQTESGGPFVSILPFETQSQLIYGLKSIQYAAWGTLWSRDVQAARALARQTDWGWVGINKSIFKFSALDDFEVRKKSGRRAPYGVKGLLALTQLRCISE